MSTQLDHITFRGDVDVLSSEVVEVGNSDHFPVVAVFVATQE